jgi:hypothetical protein
VEFQNYSGNLSYDPIKVYVKDSVLMA